MIKTVDLNFTPPAPAVAELHMLAGVGVKADGYYQRLARQVRNQEDLPEDAQFMVLELEHHWGLRQGTALHLQPFARTLFGEVPD